MQRWTSGSAGLLEHFLIHKWQLLTCSDSASDNDDLLTRDLADSWLYHGQGSALSAPFLGTYSLALCDISSGHFFGSISGRGKDVVQNEARVRHRQDQLHQIHWVWFRTSTALRGKNWLLEVSFGRLFFSSGTCVLFSYVIPLFRHAERCDLQLCQTWTPWRLIYLPNMSWLV